MKILEVVYVSALILSLSLIIFTGYWFGISKEPIFLILCIVAGVILLLLLNMIRSK